MPKRRPSCSLLEHADWLGAIVSAVRAGPGADASPTTLVDGIRTCPEVELESALDLDEEAHLEAAFKIVNLPWHVLGITDRDQRLTKLGALSFPGRSRAPGARTSTPLYDRLTPLPESRVRPRSGPLTRSARRMRRARPRRPEVRSRDGMALQSRQVAVVVFGLRNVVYESRDARVISTYIESPAFPGVSLAGL